MSDDVKTAVQRQFGNVAFNYSVSAVHASGEDLNRMVEIAALTGTEAVLDAGCGAGHTALAFAPSSASVTAYDLTPSMLEQVERLASERGIHNVVTRLGDVEQLPFEDGSFDFVVSRYSAHHWPHPLAALHEFKRVLKPGGRFILSDIVAPEDAAQDTFLQAVELLRDPSHVRDHSIEQWLDMIGQAEMVGEVAFRWLLPLDFDSWVKRMATPELNIAVLKSLYDGAPQEIRAEMDIQSNYNFRIRGALIQATLQ